jgi:hypothetical protein
MTPLHTPAADATPNVLSLSLLFLMNHITSLPQPQLLQQATLYLSLTLDHAQLRRAWCLVELLFVAAGAVRLVALTLLHTRRGKSTCRVGATAAWRRGREATEVRPSGAGRSRAGAMSTSATTTAAATSTRRWRGALARRLQRCCFQRLDFRWVHCGGTGFCLRAGRLQ